jgi:HrpA-like RNA helicase
MEDSAWDAIAGARGAIDAALFARGDYINSPSSINEFWDFFQRFHAAKLRRPQRAAAAYDPKHRINFEINPKRKPAPEDTAVVRDALCALHFFEDFNQKKRLQKAVDIGAAQQVRQATRRAAAILTRTQALPIADSRDAIIRMMSSSNVLVVAGDTGCGKSTQLPQ